MLPINSSIFDQRECPAACPCNCHALFPGVSAHAQRRVCISCPWPARARDAADPHQEPQPTAQDNFRLLLHQAGIAPPTP